MRNSPWVLMSHLPWCFPYHHQSFPSNIILVSSKRSKLGTSRTINSILKSLVIIIKLNYFILGFFSPPFFFCSFHCYRFVQIIVQAVELRLHREHVHKIGEQSIITTLNHPLILFNIILITLFFSCCIQLFVAFPFLFCLPGCCIVDIEHTNNVVVRIFFSLTVHK